MPAKKRSTPKHVGSEVETSQPAPSGKASSKPATSAKSTKSAKPAKSSASTKPNQPAKSTKSTKPAKSETSAKPAESVKASASKVAPKAAPKAASKPTSKAPVVAPPAVESMKPIDDDASARAEASTQPAAAPYTIDDIRRTAYLLSQRRQGPSDPVADWLEAERLLRRVS